MMEVVKLCAVLAFAALAGGAAQADERFGPGFLHFSASRTLMKNSHSISVSVGLFYHPYEAEAPPKITDKYVWFQGVIDGKEIGGPGQYRWTDGAACPAAMVQLRKLPNVTMPKPVLPISIDGDSEQDDIFLDGRMYTLDIESASVNGEALGAASFTTNLGSDLATWVDGMLEALQPCWSRTAPKDMDPYRGTLDDALYHQRNPR